MYLFIYLYIYIYIYTYSYIYILISSYILYSCSFICLVKVYPFLGSKTQNKFVSSNTRNLSARAVLLAHCWRSEREAGSLLSSGGLCEGPDGGLYERHDERYDARHDTISYIILYIYIYIYILYQTL